MAKKNIPYDQKYYDPEIECAPREKLEALQLERLNEELQWAYDHSPYYKRTWDEAGLKPHCDTLKDLEKFPFINKQTERQTQGVGSFFGELCCVPEDDVVYMATSSGSTGVPTMSPFIQKDFDDFMDAESRLFWQVGMRPNDRYLHGMNFALYVGGPCVIGAQNLGALGIWVGAVPSDRLLWTMKHYQPTYMWSSPSYAWLLGQKAIEKGYDPKKDFASLNHIIISGEPGGSIESTRHAIEEIWDAEVYDFFGLSDIYGACAGMCDEKDGLHLIEDQILVETIDPVTGEVLPDGEKGEIVYTTLCKRARPMIRFRSGDIGWVDKTPCKCGRTTARIHVLGRKDEMFIVSAVNVFPSDIEYVVRQDKGLTGEYRIRVYDQNYTTKYEVSVERKFGSDEPFDQISQRVEKALKAHCGVRPAKVLVYDTDKLGASSEHKAKRFIDERHSTDAAKAVEHEFEKKDGVQK
ncbi:MAG: phenylacetate--CoA ligase family protein [Coriobacteriales bacterium]|jgi:phenylacetate-CoA ligase